MGKLRLSEMAGKFFVEVQNSYPLLAALLDKAATSGNRLNFFHFVVSLGCGFCQIKRFLEGVEEVRCALLSSLNP